ncbi:IPT/TIG domain-containing protein [Candidatus Woesearchaeota archaeon]|nr:IPT/TIG domain-containing protein [Candidatus Woesearchaeota archaeon]
MSKKTLSLFCIFLIFVLGCQTAQVSDKKDSAMDNAMKDISIAQEKMAAMNVITYDTDKATVVIDELAFLPAFIHIKPNTEVTWLNRDKVEHTVAWHNRKSPTEITESDILKTGNEYKHVFDEEGVYEYICGIHPFMRGGIVVGNPPELPEMMEFAEDTAPPKVFSITPSKVSVHGGEKVIVKGQNFVEGTTVFFHHLFGDVKFIDQSTLEVITPKHYTLKMDVIVTNPDSDHFTLADSFEFFGEEEQQAVTNEFEYQEIRTPHFTGSAPQHGSSVSSPSAISVSFNYPIVKGSSIILHNLKGDKLADGGPTRSRLGLEISNIPKINPGTYKITYHAIWLGGSAHDGEFYFVVR